MEQEPANSVVKPARVPWNKGKLVGANLFMDLQQCLGLTYPLIAHDLAVVRHISNRIAVMYLGRIVKIARRAELYSRPLRPLRRRSSPSFRSSIPRSRPSGRA